MHDAKFRGALFALILLIGPITAAAQDADPIHWKATDAVTNAMPGATFKVRVSAGIDEGWHLYSPDQPSGGPIPTRLAIDSGQKFKLAGDIEAPPPEVDFDPNFNLETQIYEHEVTFGLPVQAASDVAAAENHLIVTAFYQTCNDKTCLPPKLVKIDVPVQLGAAEVQKASPSKTSAQAAPSVPIPGTPIEFTYVDFTGKPRKLSEFRGKYVLLDFWATWCSPCLADIPKLKDLYVKYRASGFEIIGMDSETVGEDADAPDPVFAKETAARARQIVASRGVTWTVATADTAVPVARKVFDVKSLPTKVLIDPEGKIIARIGENDDLVATVDKYLSKGK